MRLSRFPSPLPFSAPKVSDSAAVSALRATILALALFTVGCSKPDRPLPEVTPGVLEKHKAAPPIDKLQVPQQLSVSLQSHARNIIYPPTYDPQKANLYIIMDEHVEDTTSADLLERRYKVQEEITNIGHKLIGMGVRKQYVESTNFGREIRHDQVYEGYKNYPLVAMPHYRQKGKIKRAAIALEGIYEDQLLSVGMDNHDFNSKLKQEAQESYTQLEKAYTELLVPALKNGQLDTDNNYASWLYRSAQIQYQLVHGRNIQWANYINNDLSEAPEDTILICGGAHAAGLKPLLHSTNTFIIFPQSFYNDLDDLKIYSEEDYRQNLMDQDRYRLGLIKEKPKNIF